MLLATMYMSFNTINEYTNVKCAVACATCIQNPLKTDKYICKPNALYEIFVLTKRSKQLFPTCGSKSHTDTQVIYITIVNNILDVIISII